MTTTELLENVNDAISAVMAGGQSYKIGSRALTRADLKQLYKIRNDLMAQVAQDGSGSLLDDTYTAIFDRR